MERFASPSACLRAYIRAVLAIDENRELATATDKARANAERQRGPDKARRKSILAGKTRMFRERPLHWTREDVKFWAERARITVARGNWAAASRNSPTPSSSRRGSGKSPTSSAEGISITSSPNGRVEGRKSKVESQQAIVSDLRLWNLDFRHTESGQS